MINLNEIPRTYKEGIDLLAAWHGGVNNTTSIYSLDDNSEHVIRFVEISPDFSDQDELRPLRMGASHDFPYSSEVLLVSETDWQYVQNGRKTLPSGWDRNALRRIWPNGVPS